MLINATLLSHLFQQGKRSMESNCADGNCYRSGEDTKLNSRSAESNVSISTSARLANLVRIVILNPWLRKRFNILQVK